MTSTHRSVAMTRRHRSICQWLEPWLSVIIRVFYVPAHPAFAEADYLHAGVLFFFPKIAQWQEKARCQIPAIRN